MTLADALVDRLAAAGHGAIYFSLLARTAAGNRAALALLRPLARELARLPELRIEWIDADWSGERTATADGRRLRTRARGDAAPRAARQRLRLPHRAPGRPGASHATLIAPSLPANLPGGRRGHPARRRRSRCSRTIRRSRPTAGRTASRCRRRCSASGPGSPTRTRSTAIAATYVVAFRAAEGARDIDTDWRPEPTRVPLADALNADPATAAERGVPRERGRARDLDPRARRRAPRRTRTRTSRSTRSRASPRPRPTRRSGGCTSRPRRTSRAWWKALRALTRYAERSSTRSSSSVGDVGEHGQAARDAELGHVLHRLDRAAQRAFRHERVRQEFQHDQPRAQGEQRTDTAPRSADRSRTHPSIPPSTPTPRVPAASPPLGAHPRSTCPPRPVAPSRRPRRYGAMRVS